MLEQVIATDFAAVHFIQSFQQPLLNVLMELISFLGNPIFWFGVAAYYFWSNREHDSFYLMNLIAFVGIITDALKLIVERARPSAKEFNVIKSSLSSIEQSYSNNYSFPSGHTTLIAAVTAYFLPYKKNWKKIILLALLLLVPISRMYLGMHFLSDVIAGILLGTIIGRFNDLLRKKTEEKRIRLTSIRTRLWFATALLAALTLLMFGSYSLGFVLLGFYAGMFLMKTLKLEKELEKKRANIIGFTGLIILAIIIFEFEPQHEIKLMMFFIAGAWVSAINPLLNQKLFEKSIQKADAKKTKTEKAEKNKKKKKEESFKKNLLKKLYQKNNQTKAF